MNKREKLLEVLRYNTYGQFSYSDLADKILALDEGLSEGEIFMSVQDVACKQGVTIQRRTIEAIAEKLSGRIAKPQEQCTCRVAYNQANPQCPIHGQPEKPKKLEYQCGYLHSYYSMLEWSLKNNIEICMEEINKINERINGEG